MKQYQVIKPCCMFAHNFKKGEIYEVYSENQFVIVLKKQYDFLSVSKRSFESFHQYFKEIRENILK